MVFRVPLNILNICPYKKSERKRNCNPFHCSERRGFCRLHIIQGMGQSGQHSQGVKPGLLIVTLAQMPFQCMMGHSTWTCFLKCLEIFVRYIQISIFRLKPIKSPLVATHYTIDCFSHNFMLI